MPQMTNKPHKKSTQSKPRGVGEKRDRRDSVEVDSKRVKKSEGSTENEVSKAPESDDDEVEGDQFDFPTTKADSVELLKNWFQKQKFTGQENLEFKISNDCESTLGCFAGKDFAVGEVLFSVPQSCILGLGLTMDHPIVNFVYHEAKKHQCLDQVTVELLIWLVMIDGKVHDHEQDEDDDDDDGEGDIPPLHVYLSSLSDLSPSLLHWDRKLRKALAGTNLGTALGELDSTLRNHAAFLTDLSKWNKKMCDRLLPRKHFHLENLIWAAGHYLSRRYPGQYATQLYKDLTIDDNKLGRESNFGNVGCLIPMLDILNHNDEHEWLKFEVKNNRLHVICNQARKAGEELYSNYGALSNEQLLFAFGYSTPHNDNDSFSVKLKVPSAMPSQAVMRRGSVESVSKVFALKRGGFEGIPKDIFEALGTLTQAMDATYEPKANEQGIYEEECAILLDYLMTSILKMSVSHAESAAILTDYGVELRMKFPNDDVQLGEGQEQELTLTDESLVPQASIHQRALPTLDPANVTRAKFIAFYLLGQYQILMEAAHDLNEVVDNEADADEDDDDEQEDDDDDGEEEEDDEDE